MDVTPPREYEREHQRHLLARRDELLRVYEATIDRIYTYAVGLTITEEKAFTLLDYPLLSAAIDRELATLTQSIQISLVNGIERSFELSQRKIKATVNATYYRNATMPEVMEEILNRPQAKAMEAFMKRVAGPERLGLSERVWKYGDGQFRAEIEQNLFAGITEGKSAAEMARDQRRYLKDPDRLFRRVRDAKGVLRLSKAAKAFKPGQGTYRSSYKNALRLTATEINMAYRKADLERYRSTPFITGFRVSLSASHPTNDEAIRCDLLQGVYPLSFEWVGWHVRCLCQIVPVMPDMAEFKEYQQYLLRGEGDKFKFKNVVKEVPKTFESYMSENYERFKGWKSTPYFIKNNPSAFAKLSYPS